MAPEIKPCPFCGDMPEVIMDEGYPTRIYCNNEECFVSVETLGHQTSEDVVSIWNNRK